MGLAMRAARSAWHDQVGAGPRGTESSWGEFIGRIWWACSLFMPDAPKAGRSVDPDAVLIVGIVDRR